MVDHSFVSEYLARNFDFFGGKKVLKKYTILADGRVDVHVDCRLKRRMEKLAVKFNQVHGEFYASQMGLTSCENFPEVAVSVNIQGNRISTLKGLGNNITRLYADDNQLTNLLGCPSQVTILEVFRNPLQTLDGIPDHLDYIGFTFSPSLPLLKSLVSKAIGVTKPDPLVLGFFEPVYSIMKKYAGQGRTGSLACGAELARAGFKENARW